MSPYIVQPDRDEPVTVCDVIEKWAKIQPNHTAISFGDRKITYSQLNEASYHIAWLLSKKNVQPGDKVPVLATRSPEMVACFLGVTRAGALYVPMDIESWSDERIDSTLERISARVILNIGTKAYAGVEEISATEIEESFSPTLEQTALRVDDQMYNRPWKNIKPSDLAYIIFTSGSTSTPKGVMIPHSCVLNYTQQGGEETPFNLNATPADTVMLIFSPGFDGKFS